MAAQTNIVSAFQKHEWKRDPRNPILPPSSSNFDIGCCMNPFVIRQEDTYFLFYAGADLSDFRRVCLATAPVGDLGNWTRHGVVLDLGEAGAFDERWCVLPCVHRFGNVWHLYYTGRNSDTGNGLQSFTGIGLAVSEDLLNWQRYSNEPVLRGDGFDEWPDNKGIAGGARILELPEEDGRILYRMHYTLAVGRPSNELALDQEKLSVVAHSNDGVEWFDKQVVLRPRPDADYENVATIALNVWPAKEGFRAVYAAIGSRFGAYSICEALSRDGLIWERGVPEQNLSLPPTGGGWESTMTEYPNIVDEGGRLRLFYCGNGYGATGIGTAVAEKLR